jgi:hypothetical protein
MFLGGLWHGASWNFAFWGLIHGVGLTINHAWQSLAERTGVQLPGMIASALTLAVVLLAWVPFRADTLTHTLSMWQTMFGGQGLGYAVVVPVTPSLLWISLLSAIALLAPNSQQIMGAIAGGTTIRFLPQQGQSRGPQSWVLFLELRSRPRLRLQRRSFISGSNMKRGAILSFATFALFALLVGTLSYAAHLGIGSRTCDWRDARAGYFLAYCSAPAFGDYEHAAYFLDLEPNATKHLEKAQVIFLGNSRAEMAFSTVATQDFFRAHPVPYYVLGFGYDEKSEFALKVLRKFRPPIKLLVINTDPFFEPGWLSPAAKGADLSVKAYVAHFTKKIVAPLQQAFCRAMAEWCMPRSMSLYRAEANGTWNTIDAFQDFARGKPGQHELKDISSPALQKRALANASAFVADIGVDPKCIVLTHVPNDRFDGSSLARYLAQALGAQILLPEVANLETYDSFHLRQESAERWSTAFLVDFEPILARCVGASIAAKPGT